MAEEDDALLEVVEENDDQPYVEFDISVAPSDPSLELLSSQIERGDIVVPFYQRKFVWKIEQSSRLIESFLMGLPVPQVFLYENDEGELEVIDGQQRLMSVKYFIEGYFGEPDDKGNRKVFRLKGLSERSEFNGKRFDDLPPKYQRKLRNSTLRAINIRQLTPSGSGDSVFHIFERLNTGGTQLKPQEIRNAVYRGEIVDRLWELNENEDWQNILGLKKPDKNQKDVELVLRLLSLYHRWTEYEKPMLSHLNKFMKQNRDFESDSDLEFFERFPVVAALVNINIPKPFRPKGVINSAVLEAVMVTLLEDPSIDGTRLKVGYEALLNNAAFLERITGGTTDTLMVQKRIEIAKQII
ncbi:DUF262 domain-containing protein [Pseudodonghicola flavimaris]|uniref:DUF262 domain-containing protein n=1 Tax=Pseudodonghicola flavimaris TaxID=3050036 RepID=A0ABT7F1F6_9RHOB|nr:DUF262 domain-containing protein [Pseudodonghicola flavimaris]MDK3018437.1 DUF262 domain-containing protein [Pseudodonghicola flavimaris]